MKKKNFNLFKLFILVFALFISFIGMNLNVHAIPLHVHLHGIVIYDVSSNFLYEEYFELGSSCEVNEFGLIVNSNQVYEYEGNNDFIGFSVTENSNEITYAVGDSIDISLSGGITCLYVVVDEEMPLYSLVGSTFTLPETVTLPSTTIEFTDLCFKYGNTSFECIKFTPSAIYVKRDIDCSYSLIYDSSGWKTSFDYYLISSSNYQFSCTVEDIGYFEFYNSSYYTDYFSQDLIKFIESQTEVIGGFRCHEKVVGTIDSENDSLNWLMSWSETSDLIISDYVGMVVSDDTLTCYFVYLNTFTIPINLKCSLNSDSSKYVEIPIKCYNRTYTTTGSLLDVSLDGQTNVQFQEESSGYYDNAFSLQDTSFESIFTNNLVEFNSLTTTPVKSGIVESETNYVYSIGLTRNLKYYLGNKGIEYNDGYIDFITNRVDGYIDSLITITCDNQVYVYNTLKSMSDWFVIKVVVQDIVDGEIISEFEKKFEITGFDLSNYYAFDKESSNLFTFTIEGDMYYYESGMTWITWCSSIYNDSLFYCNTFSTKIESYHIQSLSSTTSYLAYDSKEVVKTTNIESKDYTIRYSSHSGGSA